MRLVAALLVASVGAATIAAPSFAQSDRISMNHRNTDLARLLRTLGPQLGERFLFDTTLSGRVTIAVPRPVSREQAFELLHVALGLRGFAAVPLAAGGYKIVSLPETAATARWGLGPPDPGGESRLLTLLELDHVRVDAVLQIIQPLLDQATVALPLPATNSLILGTTQRNLAALIQLLDELDRPNARQLAVRTLRYRDAEEVRSILEHYFGESKGSAQAVEAWSDPRTNAIVYRADRARSEAVADLIDRLEVPIEGSGQIAVIPIRFADAGTIAERLQALSAAPATPNAGQGAGLMGLDFGTVPDEQTNSIVVQGAPETLSLVREIVDEIDKPARQIAVELQVIELRAEQAEDLDLRLNAAVARGDLTAIEHNVVLFGNLPAAAGPEVGSTLVRVGRTVNNPVEMALVANAGVVESELLMNPTLVAAAGEEHSLFVGNNIPIPRAGEGDDSGALRVTTTIDRTDTGIEMRVRPTVGEGGQVVLDLDLDITGVAESLVSASLAQVGPTLTQQRIQTTVRLIDGETVVVASQTEATESDLETGVPFLKDLPFLGYFLRRTSRQHGHSRLVVTARTRILATRDEHTAYTIHQRLGFERALERAAALSAPPGAGWALRVTTERSRPDAVATAARLDSELRPSRVVEWRENSEALYDVYLVGFASFADAAEEALRLEREGHVTDILPAGEPTRIAADSAR